MLLLDHQDRIKMGCLMGFVKVEENRENRYDARHWCWNKQFILKKVIITNKREAKVGRVEKGN